MNEHPSMDQLLLDKLHEIIEDNLDNEQFGVEELAKESGLSRSQLHRKLNSLTGQSASQMIREFRLKKAMDLLQDDAATVAEVSYLVGFGSPSYFSTCFHDYFGYRPGEVKYRRSTNKKRKPTIGKVVLMTMAVAILLLLVYMMIDYLSVNNLELSRDIDKSIAVLPFNYLSSDNEKQYWADGITEAITNNLSKIEGLRVLPRTTAEKYRNSDKTASEISEELKISHLLEGSLHLEEENKIRLTVQLINPKEESHIFSKEYDRKVTDIFELLSSISLLVAHEIEVNISPDEQELIEKAPTNNFTAYDLYLKGRTERDSEKRKQLFNLAIELDSTFALGYVALAWEYFNYPSSRDTYFKKDFQDSALVLANIALSYDDKEEEAYSVKGLYFLNKRQFDEALHYFEKVVEINPNNTQSWQHLSVYYQGRNDFVKALSCLKRAAEIDYNKYHKRAKLQMINILSNVGLVGYAKSFIKELSLLNSESLGKTDSLQQKIRLLEVEYVNSKNDSLLMLYKMAYRKDTNSYELSRKLGYQYMFRGNFNEAYFFLKKAKDLIEERGGFELVRSHRLGYVSWKLGKHKEAEEYFNDQLRNCQESIKLKLPYGLRDAYYDLAGIYAFKGEKELAYENLDNFEWDDFYPAWFINLAKNDPMFNDIREEQRFQDIIKSMEAKNRKKRERVRVWLQENDSF